MTGGDDDADIDCPGCDRYLSTLDWDLYCNDCKKQFTRKDVDDYYDRLRIDAMNFEAKLYGEQE
ncbi:hypothetical protein [Listeria seeligeri]|uniref:hypothetical protein n=1 Tax=Listeria seeligeri TaxID=1640 RepID=UPI0010F021B3|nr:hypothetical protein [Listeria seeligeri]UCK61849.1 hypothetical protein pLIS51_00221c [Listeria seeligeri]